MNSIFKAYDVRGIYPEELDAPLAERIARAVRDHFGNGATIIIGHDTRLSSPVLYEAVLRGLKIKGPSQSRGADKGQLQKLKVIEAGMMTTPMLYFLVNDLKADCGIMVTASHNPKRYNGLKIVGKGARPVSGVQIGKLMKKYART